ncbi:MAG: radical SAM protein [Lentisphaeria bacterium]|nr:radical SAM protein [Lentisphaeria bacterium]
MGVFIEAKDTRVKKRENLAEKIPLPFPYVMYIEPTNLCNFKCIFCPTGDKELLKKVGRPAGKMEMPLFRKIIDEIKKSGHRLRLLSLYKDGEPLVHPDFPEMVRYAADSGICDRIWTKSNGALLNPELNKRLVSCGLTWLGISVEAVTGRKYLDICGTKLNYERFIENIADLYRRKGDSLHVYIKIIDTNLSDAEKQKFFDDFSGICDSYAVEKLMGWSYSSVKDFTLGTNPETYDGMPFSEKDVCAYPFYVLAVNFDGSVSLCGNDWSHATVVGNLNTESLMDVWNGERLYQFRKMLLEGRRCENKACGDCYYLKIVPDNIDDCRDILLERITRQRQTR